MVLEARSGRGWLLDYLVEHESLVRSIQSPQRSARFKPPAELADVFQRIRDISALPEDWDSYGATPPSREALAQARWILSGLRHRLPGLGSRIRPIDVAPLADGGVQLEWERPEAALELEINPDGSLSYLFVQGSGPDRQFFERDNAELDEVLRLLIRTVTGSS